MKSVDYPTGVPSRDILAMQKATTLLEELVGLSADRIEATWHVAKDDRGRTLYNLRMADWTGEVNTMFTSVELLSQTQLRSRLHDLWGDLLQIRSHKQLETLMTGTDNQEG